MRESCCTAVARPTLPFNLYSSLTFRDRRQQWPSGSTCSGVLAAAQLAADDLQAFFRCFFPASWVVQPSCRSPNFELHSKHAYCPSNPFSLMYGETTAGTVQT